MNDDVENALESGARLLARWADAKDSKLSAADKKVLRDAAKTMEDKSLSAEERLAAAQSSDIERLHETNPLRDGLSESNPQRFRVDARSPASPPGISSSRVTERLLRRRRQDRSRQSQDVDCRPGTCRSRRLQHCVFAADLPDWRDQP